MPAVQPLAAHWEMAGRSLGYSTQSYYFGIEEGKIYPKTVFKQCCRELLRGSRWPGAPFEPAVRVGGTLDSLMGANLSFDAFIVIVPRSRTGQWAVLGLLGLTEPRHPQMRKMHWIARVPCSLICVRRRGTHTYTDTHAHTWTHGCTWTPGHTCAHRRMDTHGHMDTNGHTGTQTHMDTWTHGCTWTHMDTQTHMYTHTDGHTDVHMECFQ